MRTSEAYCSRCGATYRRKGQDGPSHGGNRSGDSPDPMSGRRVGTTRSHRTLEAAEQWFRSLETAAATGIDPGQSLATFVATISDRWARAIDPSSTYDPYSAGLRLRVLPKLRHFPIGMITAGLIDRAIDDWELLHGKSTVKNTVAALVLVLDEAVRDGLLVRNPAKDRAADGPSGVNSRPKPALATSHSPTSRR